ncbi:MAG TPA: hypothetical protein VE988_02920 [Gemmataceae bacterium]|nr:hypothetical protein [Gemmataceae bacterium]
MPDTTQCESLQYRNQEFAIHHLIADCPTGTVVRELVKNAEENAVMQDPPGRIEWFIEHVEGVPKLGLYNEGPGMDGEEMGRLMDLASTGKRLGIDNNYGQGGKISALKVSPHGVVYRSCKAGCVSQIILAADHQPDADFPIYVKKRQSIEARQSNRPHDRDWTEVVLLGHNALHDTVAELLREYRHKNWLMRLLNQRFFRFADGVVVRASNMTTDAQDNRTAYGLEKLTVNHSEKNHEISAHHPRYGPLVIRYCKLRGQYGEDEEGNSRAKTMDAYGLGIRGDHICLVWKNECYDMHVGWSRISGAFGVTFGSSNIAVQILLPDSARVKNNTYRDAILDRNGDLQPVRVEEFAELIRCKRPKWLVQYIERQAQKNSNHTGVMKRLKAFLDELNAAGEGRFRVKPGGEDQGDLFLHGRNGSTSSGGKSSAQRSRQSTQPATGHRSPSQQFSGIPQVSFAEDPAILEELSGRAAIYRHEENVILLNPHHFKYLEDLEAIFGDVGPGADRQSLARQIFDEEYCFNAGKFVIQAWLFKGKPEWADRAWQDGVNPNALTIHLASRNSLIEASRRLRQKLNSRKMETQSA